jgi:hypothetical protein
MKVQKFHQQIHGPFNICYFGSPKNIDGGPCEKNLKFHAKIPGRSTQKRMVSFQKQCAQRIFDSIVIQRALRDHLGEDGEEEAAERLQMSLSIKEGKTLCGSHFDVLYRVGDDGNVSIVLEAPEGDVDSPKLANDLVTFIGMEICRFCKKKSVTVFTDHVRDGMIFRGHPSYRNGAAWNDWVFIKWFSKEVDGEEKYDLIEGQIFGFIHLERDDFDFDCLDLSCDLTLDGPGYYVIVHSMIVSAIESFEGSIVGRGLLEKSRSGRRPFRLVHVESISDVAFGIPDVGSDENAILLLKGKEKWASSFHCS